MVISTCCCGRDSLLSYLRQSWKSINSELRQENCNKIGNMKPHSEYVLKKDCV
jgi:hypothetical protein